MDAARLRRELRPDVVIMDIKMPDMDGIEAARVLTENVLRRRSAERLQAREL